VVLDAAFYQGFDQAPASAAESVVGSVLRPKVA